MIGSTFAGISGCMFLSLNWARKKNGIACQRKHDQKLFDNFHSQNCTVKKDTNKQRQSCITSAIENTDTSTVHATAGTSPNYVSKNTIKHFIYGIKDSKYKPDHKDMTVFSFLFVFFKFKEAGVVELLLQSRPQNLILIRRRRLTELVELFWIITCSGLFNSSGALVDCQLLLLLFCHISSIRRNHFV